MTEIRKSTYEDDQPRPFLGRITISQGSAEVEFGDETKSNPFPTFSVLMAISQVQNTLIKQLGEEILEFTSAISEDEHV